MANKALQQYDKQLAKIYKPQIDLVQQQYQATLPQFEAQKQSLEQAKVNAFRDIGDTAQRRGMFFSGFQPAEQARYIGEKYLPALAGVEQGQQQARLSMLEALTGLRTQQGEARLNFRETLRQEALQRALAKKDFQRQVKLQKMNQSFQAQQSALDRAASRGGGGGGGASYGDTLAAATADMASILDSKRNKYGRVSSSTYKKARTRWLKSGLNASDFDKQFKGMLAKHVRKKV